MLYWLIPKIFNVKIFSRKLANVHFWLGTLGILFYAIPLYWAGFAQASMWKQFAPNGFLVYQNFLETVTQILPMYHIRAFGGFLYFNGLLLMVYNLLKTVKAGSFVANEEASAPPMVIASKSRTTGEGWHRFLERKPIRFLILSTIAVLFGGIIEIVPTYLIRSNIPTISSVKPYTPLELEGRDIYIKEGCYNCHSQMIRPFRSETERYGEYSKAGEFVYDHPFQFGSKRTGPDLSREGVKTLRNYKPDKWHYEHLIEPQKTSPNSVMPPYPWLAKKEVDFSVTSRKIKTMIKLGVPYPEDYPGKAKEISLKQAEKIAEGLRNDGIDIDNNKEIIALIAYLQRLGTDIMVNNN